MAGLERYMSMPKASRLMSVLEENGVLGKVLRSLGLDSEMLSQKRFRTPITREKYVKVANSLANISRPPMSMNAASISRHIPEKTNFWPMEKFVMSLTVSSSILRIRGAPAVRLRVNNTPDTITANTED